MNIRNLPALFLALALLFCLCACERPGDPDLGRYSCVRAVYPDGTDAPGGEWLELKKNGRAQLCLQSAETTEWAREGERFLIRTGENTAYAGTLSGGVVEIVLGDIEYVFVKEGVVYDLPPLEPAPEPVPDTAEEDAAAQAARALAEQRAAYWSRGWYGWWFIRDADGAYAALDGAWWDLCAEIEADADGSARMTLWDEEGSRAQPYGEAKLSIDYASGSFGEAVSEAGCFGPTVVGAGDWRFAPDDHEYENLLVFSGVWQDETGSYTFEAYLRPWGQRWDDVQRVSPDLLPYFYHSWYLPRIEAGDTMPDRIGEGAEPRNAA